MKDLSNNEVWNMLQTGVNVFYELGRQMALEVIQSQAVPFGWYRDHCAAVFGVDVWNGFRDQWSAYENAVKAGFVVDVRG